jgi:hypothetical protein
LALELEKSTITTKVKRRQVREKTEYNSTLGIARGAITVWGILGPGFRIRL